ncbi:MAG TPA: CPBP family intramembrane glutamic endopeptidase [Mucilaginibacter sp.]|nr:CPBP family intramembrane glutamic endopeptidase [Mucilaginibacter sp.]
MTDTPFNPIPHKQIHPARQFFIFIGLFLLIYIIGNILGGVVILASYGKDVLTDIANLNITAKNQNAVWLLQFIGVTLPILISPVIFSKYFIHEPDEYLKTNFNFPWILIIVVFFTMMISLPLIEFLSNLNAKMTLPRFLKGLEEWMRDTEGSAKKISDGMMEMRTIWNMIFALIFIGLLTAVVEEIMFRGCLQTILMKWSKNKHIAIWITAILFSAFHMEFFGFLPRMMLGLLFGYFAAWSGSVWPGIWGHFVNNGTIVVLTYLQQRKMLGFDPDSPHLFNSTVYIISLIITLFLLFIYRYISNKKQIADINGEELD